MKNESLPKVLFVDDEPNVLAGIKRELHGKFDLYAAEGGYRGLDLIREQGPFAVVVSDMRMPEMDGAQFLTEVRALSPDTERALLTGHADVDSAIAAVNEGKIFRYLVKPCEKIVLLEALHEGIKKHQSKLDMHKICADHEQLREVAAVDVLLKIPNNYALERDMEKTIATVNFYEQTYSFVMLGVSDFAKYQEFYGSQSSDKVLQIFADHLSFHMRLPDCLYRYADDKFMLVLPEVNSDTAKALIIQIMEGFNERSVAVDRGYIGAITINAVMCDSNLLVKHAGSFQWLCGLLEVELQKMVKSDEYCVVLQQ